MGPTNVRLHPHKRRIMLLYSHKNTPMNKKDTHFTLMFNCEQTTGSIAATKSFSKPTIILQEKVFLLRYIKIITD